MNQTKLTKVFALAATMSMALAACGGAPAPTAVPAKPTDAPKPAATQAPAPTPLPTLAYNADATVVNFLSTQAAPVAESEAMRKKILTGNAAKVEFIPVASAGQFADQLTSEAKANKGLTSLTGALVGDVSPMAASLKDLSALKAKLADRNIPEALWQIGKLGTNETKLVPWMQATLLMAVNKKALQYLPAGADVNTLTYDQLLAWGKAIKEGTKEAKIGFPAADAGLIHRFFQGDLIPSYTGGVVTTFAGEDAEKAWTYFADLWQYVNPQSTTFANMQEQLQSEEVWIAIDHVARLKDAFANKPNDFIAAPVPLGPKGRGYMVILAGLSIPALAPNQAGAEATIEHLTKNATQAVTLDSLGFYPVSAQELTGLTPGQLLMANAVKTQANAKDSIATLIPQGLGGQGGNFNKVFRDTFTQIVLNKANVKDTLAKQKVELQKVMDTAKAACWAPDADSKGAVCQVK
ncbi:MAG TPA: ABC transporter substrate-binding protein [Thermoflexales bacterium]|nr:ABC transporter substrate-binding protein [Thermoflexales bacterium]HQW36563.1 ABC transporter substrate-binding protein [Thermoflexales bacterium]HQZ22583.1 ABC transporter substrate-binding protein [Thermoflexales bacterium]HQZ99000.1 ABC transporter substrate-binding protein [Thermoflexales bacterium]